MTAKNINAAWGIIDQITKTDYNKDEAKTARAGYPVYVCNDGGYICDLNTRLEYTDANGETVNVWIDNGNGGAETHAERVITLCIETERTNAGEISKTQKEARLTLSSETTLRDIANFERGARIIVKNARGAKLRGESVTVVLTAAKYQYTNSDDLKQIDYQEWTGDGEHITGDGVHLKPSAKYNSDPCQDMWLTGARGEILDEMTI